MAENKSIMDEILSTINEVENTVNENAEEILRSTMSEEIGQILEASIKEADAEEEEEVTDELIDANDSEEEGMPAIEGEPEEPEELEVNADDVTDAIDSAIEGGDEEEIDVDYEMGMGTDVPSIADVDLTDADDDEVIKVFKKLTDDDEIEVVSDTEVKITEPQTGTEYKVEMGDGNSDNAMDNAIGDEIAGDIEMEDDFGVDDMGVDEMVYEIEMTDETMAPMDQEEDCYESDEKLEQEEDCYESDETLEEQIPNSLPKAHKKANIKGKDKGSPDPVKVAKTNESKAFVTKYNKLLEAHKNLKAENAEIKEAVKKLRGAFKETAVFSSNLAHATKLFTENSTNKAEKKSILKRFDEATSLDESKKLYKVIKEELAKNDVSDKVEKKLTESATSSSSSELNENRAYVDQSTKNILDLMRRVG
jgi:ribosomal protein S6E (S10)